MNSEKGSASIIIGVLVVLGVIGGVVYFNSQPEAEKMMDMGEEMMHDGEAMMEEGEKMMEEGEKMMEEGEKMIEGETMTEDTAMMEKVAGAYEDYSPEKVAQASGDVLLFFHATWCPTCRALDGDISRNLDSIPSDLTILKADFDGETALKQQYGVTLQHTMVQIDNSGNLIKKWTGSPNLDSVLGQVQ